MASVEIEQLTAFYNAHFGPDVATVFEQLVKNRGISLQSLVQSLRIDTRKRSFFPAENTNFSSNIKVVKYHEKTELPSQFTSELSRQKALNLTRRCLTVLLTHDLAAAAGGGSGDGDDGGGDGDSDGPVRYSTERRQWRQLIRSPQHLLLTRKRHGRVAELLLEELLLRGRLAPAALLAAVGEKLAEEQQQEQQQVASSLNCLLRSQLVRRRYRIGGGGIDASKEFAELSRDEIQRLLASSSSSSSEPQPPPSKRPRLNSSASLSSSADSLDCELSANSEQLCRCWRDELLATLAGGRAGAGAARTMSATLAIVDERQRLGLAASPESELVSHADIAAQLAAPSGGGGGGGGGVDEHLGVLVDDGFLEKVSGSGGGQFRVLYKRCLYGLAKESVVSIVRQRFGPQAVRMFNTLCEQPNLTQSELEAQVLVGGRDCKELLYKMLADGFAHCSELSRASDFMHPRPNSAFYLFHVNLEQTVRRCLLQLFAAQRRLLARRLADAAANRRLLEKQQRVDSLVANLDRQLLETPDSEELQEQRSQATQLLTPTERQQLEELQRSAARYAAGELQTEEAIFVFQLFLEFASSA